MAYAVGLLSLRLSGTFSVCGFSALRAENRAKRKATYQAAAGEKRGVGYPLGDAKQSNCVSPKYFDQGDAERASSAAIIARVGGFGAAACSLFVMRAFTALGAVKARIKG